MATTEERLLVRLEADARKFVNEASKLNDTIKQKMTQIDRDFQSANGKVVEGVRRKVQAFNDAGAGIGRYRSQIQNASFQVGDFAVQVAGGTSAARAMAQQLPQLLGGLGMFGALAGAAAAIAIPLAANLFSAGEGAVSADDAMSSLDAAFASYTQYAETATMTTSELTEKFGVFADEVKGFSAYMAQVSVGAAIDSAGTVVDATLGSLADLREKRDFIIGMEGSLARMRASAAGSDAIVLQQEAISLNQAELNEIATSLGMTVDQALRLSDALLAVKSADGMADLALRAADAQAILQSMVQSGYELPGPLREVAGALDAILTKAAAANAEIGGMEALLVDAASAAASIAANVPGAGWLAGAIGDAGTLATKLWEAASAKAAAAGGVPGATRDQKLKSAYGLYAFTRSQAPAKPVSSDSGSGSGRSAGGGGRAVDPGQWLADRMATAEAAVAAAQAEAASIGLVGQAAIEAKVKHEMLAEAKKRGLDLDKQSVKSGETLRAEIGRQATAVAELTWKAEQYRARAQMMTEVNESLKNGFLDAVVAGKDLSGVLQNVAQMLAKAALEAALFGTGPMSGGGGLMGGGGLLGNLFGGLFGGFREGGGDVSAGKAYVVGEKRPELFVPSSSGRIVPQVGGSGGAVDVRVSLSGDLDARIERTAGAVSARQVRQASVLQRRGLPQAMADVRNRGG